MPDGGGVAAGKLKSRPDLAAGAKAELRMDSLPTSTRELWNFNLKTDNSEIFFSEKYF